MSRSGYQRSRVAPRCYRGKPRWGMESTFPAFPGRAHEGDTLDSPTTPCVKRRTHMAKNLVIVESPTKAKPLERYLGKEFSVKASFGHIRDLFFFKIAATT